MQMDKKGRPLPRRGRSAFDNPLSKRDSHHRSQKNNLTHNDEVALARKLNNLIGSNKSRVHEYAVPKPEPEPIQNGSKLN